MPPHKINLVEAADQKIKQVFDPHIAGDVNDAQVKIAKFGDVFDWHAHDDEDEAFLVQRGRMPRSVEHRPRSLSEEPVVLMFEPATTLNTGNAKSDLTVADLKRL
ncbi:cupin domain-containing protein [Mesorhizobium delmotii]|uniref:Cupin n=1 Tax=Mesorhizobium delmotii TaxID=1631247 RepID=A0A2P9AKD4_9HYPH|nr:cupin domain-containing protein [Mesorhizobium delmotii]SJM31583.1 Cupin [Mesorhizobium delmotii]